MTSVGECVVIGNKREQNIYTRTLSLFKDFVIYETKMLIILKNYFNAIYIFAEAVASFYLSKKSFLEPLTFIHHQK